MISSVMLILVCFGASHYFYEFTSQTRLDTMLYFAVIALMVIGVWKGVLLSLGISLLMIFALGSYMLGIELFTDTSQPEISITHMIIWQVALIVASYTSGIFHTQKGTIIKQYQFWAKRYNELVTIDPNTGFDNEKRFYFELNEEFKRATRYEQQFTLLLIKIKNWNEFEKLYGPDESTHILRAFAANISQATRASDSRFRVFDDTFALILPETDAEGTETVMKKISTENEAYALKNKDRYISLTFGFGYTLYSKQLDDYMRMFNHALDELNQHVA